MTNEPPADGQDPDELQHEVEVLEQENEALRHQVEVIPKPKKRRGRTIASWVLIVLACLLAVLSVVVVYARNELLNTDTFVATVAPLAKDKAIQTTVATKVSENLVARTDIQQRVQNALPEKAGFLANPITGAVQTATYQITLKLVQSPRFQTLWEQALRRSHEQVDNLLLGNKVGALQSTNGQVTVDLSQVENAAKQQLSAHGLSVFNKLPNYTGAPFVLFQSDQLAKLQRWVKFLNHLALALPIVSILMFAGAVVLARDRRRGLVHAASGLAVSMAVLLIAANVGRNQYLSSLNVRQSKAATAAIIDTVDAALLDTVRIVLIVAAIVAIVAFVVGLGPVRRWMHERTAPSWLSSGPVHDTVAGHRRAFQWGALVLGLVVLVLWNQPTVLVALIIVLVTLFVVMLVGLFGARRPTTGGPPAGEAGPGPTVGAATATD
ncbi:MAG TPA: hypothetical protein VIH95_08715 [Acidimicrobiales bacterium]